ncbi:MAG TPA: cytochrome c oxidase accessory protein CcoG [Hyphomicrobiales bacterium]|nr:cytochrome c oxidase accessory protein CcoG [Hyphomicrobiales bacterium]
MTDTSNLGTLTREAAPGVPEVDAKPVNSKASRPLYAGREPIYPKLAHGKFRRIKWAVMIVTLGIYYGLPWLRWNRGPALPDQAVLFDFPNQRLLFPGFEVWPQEFYFVTAILILSALGLFLVTAIAGRVWCGYACPQTVWTDLMIAVERLWQGDRNARMRLAKQPWSFGKAWRVIGTHLSWLIIAFLTGGALVFYFRDAPTLLSEFWHFNAPIIAYIFLGLFTATTYLLGGLAREQVCTYMCPWPRIQGAMFDADSLLVSYRTYRGEPRGPHKKGESWEGRGDCIDCKQCVAVCPAGIDIRDGPQLECIQCALCIDACDEIMVKVGRPKKLIAYDTFRNLDAACHGGRAARLRLIRPRTLLYAGAFAIVLFVTLIGLSQKTLLDLNVVPDRNPLFVVLSDSSIRNGYMMRVINKRHESRSLSIRVEGLAQSSLRVVGMENSAPLIEVNPDEVRSVRVFVTLPRARSAPSIQFAFVVADVAGGSAARRVTNFRGPEE